MVIKRALQIVFALSLLGTVFSGTLSYGELFGSSAISCPSPGAPGTILGYPACVYGFFMFTIIFMISAGGLYFGAREAAAGNA
ncbi:MAG TPA: hypothetical protein VMV51_12405 [Gemmatimonadaceae bacterium]|nr:hypothetical protein [Gemmatimonadaceae bacterium]